MERPQKRILILSDLIGKVKDYRKALEKQNYRLYFATDEKEALSMLSNQNIDILITDITLPGMDLAELCKTVKTGTYEHLPVIMLCSEFEKHLLEEGLRCGADDFILIPSSGEELTGRIHLQLIRMEVIRRTSGDVTPGSETPENNDIRFELDLLRQRNQKLVTTGKKLLELGKIKNNLLRVICHELKTPVSAIIGFTEILLEENAKKDEGNILQTITAASQKMKMLTDLALTVSQIDPDNLRTPMQHTNIGTVVGYAVADTLGKYDKKAIRISGPDKREISEIDIHPGMAGEVISIFLANAIHYSPVGGCVHLKLSESGGNIELEIADEGVGFNKQMLYRIRAFLAGKSLVNRTEWPGLRFAIARFIMDLHQAEIKVENNANGGASVKLIFPVNIAKNDALHHLLSQLN